MLRSSTLAVFSNLRGVPTPDGRVVLTRKFVDGMSAYADRWSGPVKAVLQTADRASSNLDSVVVARDELPFRVQLADFRSAEALAQLDGCGVALLAVSSDQNHLAAECVRRGVPCVYVSEYSLRTRLQIVKLETRNPLLRLRRGVWQLNQERRQRDAIRTAHGLQCNGTPTYNAYRSLNRSPLLFFDTRLRADAVITRGELEARLARLQRGGPLRIGFSGRLIAMKGADHLIDVARELRSRTVAYRMTIWGGGELEPQMKAAIAEHGLHDQVELAGVCDFQRELVHRMRREVDLFVCCHRQGDPSCTYLETLACGVPIAGYRNEALAGLLRSADVGRGVRGQRPAALAELVRKLERDRSLIATLSRRAREFAAGHTFEPTMSRRVDHLRSIALRRSNGRS